MVSILLIIVNSLSKQYHRSFSNINYSSVIEGGHMLKGKMVPVDGNRWLEGKSLLTGACFGEIVRKEKVYV